MPRIRLMQGPARFRRRLSFPSRLPPQRYRGPPLKRASGRLRHQSRPRCPPLSAQSPQSKQALGRNGRLTQPRHRPLSAQGLQPKHALGHTGSRILHCSPPPSARGLQPKQASGRYGLSTQSHSPLPLALARASQLDKLTFPSRGRRDLPIQTVSFHLRSDAGESLPTTQLDLFRLYLFDTSIGVGLGHPPIFLFDGRRGLAFSRHRSRPPAEHRPPVSPILTPFPPAWRGLPVRSLLSLNLHRMLREPSQSPGFLFSLPVGEAIRLTS
ncbi:hypothetical protein G5714_004484 [Onychostoma macrolepis]|uniref:Uncharacterized protein n=1 Tax=Onychostoma macrolepis TaxID=369639 RepID=A0A7J6D4V1_9TELE|nr:hypothetical protein G5714_004484 [Onychostoma macrolepis]